MALFGNKTPAPLLDQLIDKSDELRDHEQAQSRAAVDFIEASAHAKAEAQEAARKAAAVEQAVTILADAGVDL